LHNLTALSSNTGVNAKLQLQPRQFFKLVQNSVQNVNKSSRYFVTGIRTLQPDNIPTLTHHFNKF